MSNNISLLFLDIMNNNLEVDETKISDRKKDCFIRNNNFGLVEKDAIIYTKLENKVLIVKKLMHYSIFLIELQSSQLAFAFLSAKISNFQ